MFIYVLIHIFYPFFFIFMQTIMQTIFKVFNLLQYSLLSFDSFFGLEAREISAPQPRFELPPLALEGKVLTAGLLRKPLYVFSKESSL